LEDPAVGIAILAELSRGLMKTSPDAYDSGHPPSPTPDGQEAISGRPNIKADKSLQPRPLPATRARDWPGGRLLRRTELIPFYRRPRPLRAISRWKSQKPAFSSGARPQVAISPIGALWGSGRKTLDCRAFLAARHFPALARCVHFRRLPG
jgi:hypothetical protein